jgi:hypothetical protein
MISTYRLFQIIMGIILSGFIFYMLLGFAGDYAMLGEGGIRQKTLDVFLEDADTVYLSGNPVSFTQFSGDDYSSCHPRATTPPVMHCFIDGKAVTTRQLMIPIFMRLGDEVLIYRGSLNLGWTSLDYVEALSGFTVVFNPRDSDEDTWRIVRGVAAALPDTTDYTPKVFFDFCDGNDLLIRNAMGASYERRDFLGIIGTTRDAYSGCTAPLSQNQILVTISQSCTQSSTYSGICIKPSSGAGEAYMAGSNETYVYKDSLDLAALIIGGTRKTLSGKPMGEETWRFKNEFMLASIRTLADVMERRCDWIMQLDVSSVPQECKDLYLDLKYSLEEVRVLLDGDYQDVDEMDDLNQGLESSGEIWQDLVNMGCEVYGS